ncbi:MAG: EF-P lysine aminoacylase EpmA, partial [bacterium]|nr:EF-P lysine aminoacylase EpmA [bacterium]
FLRQGFVEVETPTVVEAPGHEPFLQPRPVADGGWLITSPEYHMKRLLASGSGPRIFQICRCFRGDEHGPHHRSEFTMVEWYRAHAAYDRIITDVERLVASTARALRGLDVVQGPAGPVDLHTPWPRMTVTEAFRLFAGVDLASAQDIQALSSQARDAGCISIDEQDDWESGFHKLLVERVEPGLTALGRGIHLCQYPVQLAALAQREPDDATVAQRFESYARGLELANGFGELTDPREQRRRFRDERLIRCSHGLSPLPVDEPFLRDLEGMPPASGVALGLDRLLMVVTSADHIDDVVGF